MPAQRILLPYNFTAHEKPALDFVINTFSKQQDVTITLFNTYTPVPVVDTEANPEMRKMGPAVAYFAKELSEKEAGLKFAKQYLVEKAFSDDQVNYIFKKREKDIAQEIVGAALEGGYSILVLSRQPGKAARLLARSVHNKVLSSLKNITVCIAM
jgi:hypothetical protein